MPGPGTFNVSYDWSNLKKNAGFGSSKRNQLQGNAVPGPGNYNPADAGKAKPPAFSMRMKTPTKTSNQFTPGPGAYKPNNALSKENLGNVKIGTSKRDQ